MSARTQRHARLLVPGLFVPLTAAGVDTRARAGLLAGLSLECLEGVLAMAKRAPPTLTDTRFETLLASVFGMQLDPATGCPSAALTREMDLGDAGDAVWLRADPVSLQADFSEATLLHHTSTPTPLRITSGEASLLAEAVNEALAEESISIETPNPRRWYLRRAEMPRVRLVSPYELAGGSLREQLPSGPEGAYWRRLLNITQTALYACPVNSARERAGVAPVNSLWFFGAGRLPGAPGVSFAGVWSEHELLGAMACRGAAPVAPLPADATRWLASEPAPGTHLLFYEACREAVCGADGGAWCNALLRLQDEWLAPLVEALKKGRLASVQLVTDGGATFTLTRGALRCFWRRRRPLATIAALHAEHG